MRLPNKFNGYSRDGVRLYNDPATLAIGAGLSTGTMAGTTLLTTGALAGGTAALGAGLAAGLAAGGLGTGATSLLGGALPGGIASQAGAGGLGSMTGAAPTVTATGAPAFTPGVTAASSPQGIASAFDPNKYLASSGFEPVKAAGVNKDIAALMPDNVAALNPSSSPSVADSIRNVQTQVQGNAQLTQAPGVETIGARPAQLPSGSPIQPNANFVTNLGNLIQNPSLQGAKDYAMEHPYATSAAAALGAKAMFSQPDFEPPKQDTGMVRPYTLDRSTPADAYSVSPTVDTSERRYFTDAFTAGTPYRAAEGGIASAYAVGGPVEEMSALNAIGANTGYPQAMLHTSLYANPMPQRPEAFNVIAPTADTGVETYTGEPRFAEGGDTTEAYKYSFDPQTQTFSQIVAPQPVPAKRAPIFGFGLSTIAPKPVASPVVLQKPVVSGGIAPAVGGPTPTSTGPAPAPVTPYQTAQRPYVSPEEQLGLTDFYSMMDRRLADMGGYSGYAGGGEISNLGGYSDGGRLLKGPGDGVSDSIPAVIGKRQPARLADGEFVIPARIVSELGNGSTEAGARKLYAMMDRVQKRRKKSVGKGKVAVDSKADKLLPA